MFNVGDNGPRKLILIILTMTKNCLRKAYLSVIFVYFLFTKLSRCIKGLFPPPS